MSNFQEWCVKVLPFIQAAANGEVVQGSCNNGGEWFDLDSAPACDPALTFDFDDYDYRIKPRTIMIGDIEVPEPMRNAIGCGEKYFVPLLPDGGAAECTWVGRESDCSLINNGLCHETRGAAIIHAKALISLTAKKGASHE